MPPQRRPVAARRWQRLPLPCPPPSRCPPPPPPRCRRAAAAAVTALPAAVLALMTPRCHCAAAKLPSWPLPTRFCRNRRCGTIAAAALSPPPCCRDAHRPCLAATLPPSPPLPSCRHRRALDRLIVQSFFGSTSRAQGTYAGREIVPASELALFSFHSVNRAIFWYDLSSRHKIVPKNRTSSKQFFLLTD